MTGKGAHLSRGFQMLTELAVRKRDTQLVTARPRIVSLSIHKGAAGKDKLSIQRNMHLSLRPPPLPPLPPRILLEQQS